MTEVPKDYVLEMMKEALSDKITSTECNLRTEMVGLKTDIHELKVEIKEFQNQCRHDMHSFDKRIKSTEEFKIKVIALSGFIVATSAFLFTLILK